MSEIDARFDGLLRAMLTRPPLKPGAGKKAAARPASGADASEDSGGTRTPKGRSGATSSTLKRKSRT